MNLSKRKGNALRRPYRTRARARVMGEAEEVQEKMKADMEAMKEQMATMMEAMMSMKKIMEANAVIVATTSAVAKVNPMLPSGLNEEGEKERERERERGCCVLRSQHKPAQCSSPPSRFLGHSHHQYQ